MEITYLGHSAFLIKCGKVTVITDPFDESVGFPFKKIEANIVTVSHHHYDHDATSLISGEPLILDMAGEYEKDEVRITGWETFHDESNGSERGKNIVFKIEYSGVSVLHLGDLGHLLTSDMIEEIGVVDVLLTPIGGVFTINSDLATKIVSKIEPSYVIPMHFRTSSHSESFAQMSTEESFLQKMGAATVVASESLKLTTSSEEKGDTQVILLQKA